MALQGTIDTFALGDVLRLLAATGKTGRLALDGDRGRGEVVVVDGSVRSIALDRAGAADAAHDESLFELLRFADAGFVFDPDETVRDLPGEAVDVEPLIEAAEGLLGEWREIEQVVPSPAAWLTLRSELSADEVVLDAERWRLVATVGSGTDAASVAERFGTSELATGRLVRTAVELGLVDVAPTAPGGAAAPAPVTEATPAPVADAAPAWTSAPATGAPAAFVDPAAQPPAAPAPHWTDDLPEWPEADEAAESQVDDAGSAPASDAGPHLTVLDGGAPFTPGLTLDDDRVADLLDDGEDSGAAEFARQLANLSPKAAKAVAAAARAESPEERDRVLAEVEASEEGLDHDLLLRFIGSSD